MAITSPIFEMFGRSPIRPLQEHMNKVTVCAEALLPFFEAVLAEDWPKAERRYNKIDKLENEADTLKRELRLHLPKGLFLPVARTDLLELLSAQDRIANKAKDVAGLFLGRKMALPAKIADSYISFVKRGIDAAQQANKAINELDELLETGFKGNEVKLVNSMIQKLDKIESDTDKMEVKIRKKLFEFEEKLPPIQVIFLYKSVDWTGDLADCAQTVGGRLQLLLAR